MHAPISCIGSAGNFRSTQVILCTYTYILACPKALLFSLRVRELKSQAYFLLVKAKDPNCRAITLPCSAATNLGITGREKPPASVPFLLSRPRPQQRRRRRRPLTSRKPPTRPTPPPLFLRPPPPKKKRKVHPKIPVRSPKLHPPIAAGGRREEKRKGKEKEDELINFFGRRGSS